MPIYAYIYNVRHFVKFNFPIHMHYVIDTRSFIHWVTYLMRSFSGDDDDDDVCI